MISPGPNWPENKQEDNYKTASAYSQKYGWGRSENQGGEGCDEENHPNNVIR